MQSLVFGTPSSPCVFEKVSRAFVADIALRRRWIGDTDEFSPVPDQPSYFTALGRGLKSPSHLSPQMNLGACVALIFGQQSTVNSRLLTIDY
jgi:hypothetical protein